MCMRNHFRYDTFVLFSTAFCDSIMSPCLNYHVQLTVEMAPPYVELTLYHLMLIFELKCLPPLNCSLCEGFAISSVTQTT